MRASTASLLLAALVLQSSATAQQPSYYQPAPPNKLQPPAVQGPAPLKLAPRSSTSRGSVARPASPTATSALGTVAGSLGIVLGLYFVLAWITRRYAPPGSSPLPKEAVETLGRAPFSGKQQLQLLKVGNKLLLVAQSATGIETLTEITDPAEVEHLTALCRRGQGGNSSAAFRQVLNQIAAEPAPPGFLGQPSRQPRGGR
jgi:flagellar biogenesis protein FliO